MKSLHLCSTTQRRGAETFAMQLAEQLTELDLPSTAVALQGSDAAQQLPLTSLGQNGRSPRAILRGRALANKVDVVVGHGSDTLLAGAAITWGIRTPFVYQLIGDPTFWGDVKLGQLRLGWPLRRAGAVVALWPAAADALVNMYRIHPEAVHVIGNGRDPRHFRPPNPQERAEARRALNLPHGAAVVCWVGSLSWEKQPILAIDAIDATPGGHLLMAGDGPERASVAARAEASSQRVSVLGSVTDVRRAYWASDLLLMTSRTEGLPGVLVEAGLCGLPAVAPDVGGISELVDECTGEIVASGAAASDYGSAIATVLGDGERRGEAMRRRAAAGHAMPVIVDAWRSLLELVSQADRS